MMNTSPIDRWLSSGATGIVLIALLVLVSSSASAQLKTRNVVLIVSDGVRWQEIFTGAERDLMNFKHGGIWGDQAELARKFWRDDVGQRRQVLFPFLWTEIAAHGEIFGNQKKHSVAHVTNGMNFSYPGYNEMITGHADPRIDSNAFGPNPNVNVFEWLNRDPELHGKVAVYGTWDAFNRIFNAQRSGLVMQIGWDLPAKGELTPRQELLNELYETTIRMDDELTYDSFLQIPLLDYVRAEHPRALFVGYGETDDWGHAGRYDLVLKSAHQFDAFVKQLWDAMQAMPEYHDQTTFIVTTDHGRGGGLTGWREHGSEEKGSENIWIAVLGPDTPPLGERQNVAAVTQAQIAATIAALLGRDFRKEAPAAAEPLPIIQGSNP